MTGRPKRTVRTKMDTNFVYPSTKPKTSISTKRQLKQAKQSEMKLRPDVPFCDLPGEEWKLLEDTSQSEAICDIQFFTKNLNHWKRELHEHFNLKVISGELKDEPTWVDRREYPQLIVKGPDGKQEMTFKFFDTGIVLVQGKNFEHFCRHELAIVRDRIKVKMEAEKVKDPQEDTPPLMINRSITTPEKVEKLGSAPAASPSISEKNDCLGSTSTTPGTGVGRLNQTIMIRLNDD